MDETLYTKIKKNVQQWACQNTGRQNSKQLDTP